MLAGRTTAANTAGIYGVIPLLLRLPIAAVLVVWAARTSPSLDRADRGGRRDADLWPNSFAGRRRDPAAGDRGTLPTGDSAGA